MRIGMSRTRTTLANEGSEVSNSPRRLRLACSAFGRVRLLQFSNVILRGATLGSKFVLLIVIAEFMTPTAVGQYGILVATVNYALFVLGLDFYTYSTREMLGSPRDCWPSLLRNQAAFFFVCYGTMLPVLYLFFRCVHVLPGGLELWFFVLLLLEHLAQELSRVLVIMAEPVSATFLGFLRGGLWVFACVVVMAVEPRTRIVETIMIAWTFGSLCSVIFGLVRLGRLPSSGRRTEVNWRWIWCGVKVCVPLLVSTLAIRGLFVADRYMERYFAGAEILGVYTFYINIANAMQAFLDAAVFSFQYPRVVEAARSGNAESFSEAVRRLASATRITLCALVLIAGAGIKPLLGLLHRPIYAEHLGMFAWILTGTVLFCLSMVPHYALYAVRRDRAIIATNLSSVVVFIVAAPLLALYLNALAVPVALVLAYGAMYTSKLLLCLRYGTLKAIPLTS